MYRVKFPLLIFFFALLFVINPVCTRAGTWENSIWLSTSLDMTSKKLGYYHQGDFHTRIMAELNGNSSFEISLSNPIIYFDKPSTGLYGETGINYRNNLNFLFGGGFIYTDRNSEIRLTIGPRYYIPDNILVTEMMLYYKILPPFFMNIGYENRYNNVYIGLGVSFE